MANILQVPTVNRSQSVFARAFYYASFVLSRTTDTSYTDVSKKVLSSSKVKEAIRLQVDDEYKDWIEKKSQHTNSSDDGYVSSSNTNRSPIDKIKYHHILNKHRKRAFEIFEGMRSCISSSLLRIAGWILYKLLSRLLNTVQIHKGQLEILKRTAVEENIPIVYIPMHRSHLDYILLSFILYMNNIKPPLVAAGDNLSIPFFGNLMRGLGAFFIKRKFNDCSGHRDYVYRAILQSYMIENLKAGNSIEFFIEGGRSRSGKACMPKAGLLSVIVSAILESEINDVYIVPIGISYEKIMDGNFVPEQLGKKKVTEKFSLALKAIWSKLSSHFGNVRIDFCQPFSLKDYLRHSTIINNNAVKNRECNDSNDKIEFKELNGCGATLTSCVACASSSHKRTLRSLPSLSDFYGLEMIVSEDKRQSIKDLSEHIVYDAFNSSAIMSTQLLAFLLLTKHRKGATIHQLSQGVSWLRDEFIKRKRDVGFSGDSIDIARHACNVLGKELIIAVTLQMPWPLQNEAESNGNIARSNNNNVRVQYFKPATKLPHVLELHYYSNNCTSVFLLDSIVANAIFALLDTEIESLVGMEESNLTLSKNLLISKSLELCNLLQYDFIFSPPCRKLSDAIDETIENFINIGLLSRTFEPVPYRRQCQSLEYCFEVDDFDDEVDKNYFSNETNIDENVELEVSLSQDSSDMLYFYRSILSPYIESYWLTTCSLIRLIGKQKDEKSLITEIIDSAKERLSQGLLNYEECVAADTLQNALTLLQSWKVIDVYVSNSTRNYQLNPHFDNKEAINDLILSIETFKK